MYLAKLRITAKEFEGLYPQTGLKAELKPTFVNIVLPALRELREVMDTAEDEGYSKFKDIEWRLSISIGSRLKKEMFEPKFTMRLTMEDEKSNTKNFLIDSDYSNMVKLRDELTEALQSLESPFSKKVFKFLK
uniref:COMM domain-containing protein n=1 Tax=Euplotes harpa TaxID=151035 RepID=A0A7S3J7M7_9SPIT|mmetsp:Transcript_24596/g.28278  ORF Transcript_24596/g.28278 Transcript_24596/m.28278 type:complete len:133 (+) Transcript_24596:191-589(+)